VGLQAAGHEVTLCASRRFAAEIAGHGLLGTMQTALCLLGQVGPLQLQVQRDCRAAEQP